MQGIPEKQATMLSLVSPEQRIPPAHPLREIKKLADEQLDRLSAVLDKMYASTGRPSIPPEQILKAMVLMALYSVRSERQLCEQLDYNLLFRWFLDMNIIEESFDPTVFSKNRERLMRQDVGRRFFDAVVRRAKSSGLISEEHFTVDSTLIEAWASLKSFRPRGEAPGQRPTDGDPGNPTVDFRGEKRSNSMHCFMTDPESRLLRKSLGHTTKLSYSAHALMENRHGLLVDLKVTPVSVASEWEAAEQMLKRQARRGVRPGTLGADKGYDTRAFVGMLRGRKITPHVAAHTQRRGGSAIDGRTCRHAGYAMSRPNQFVCFFPI